MNCSGFRAALVAVLAIVAAGCGASPPGATASPSDDAAPPTTDVITSTTTDAVSPTTDHESPQTAGVRVVRGTLPFDANRTWRRVETMHATNASPPVVYVDSLDGNKTVEPDEFMRLLGMREAPARSPDSVNGRVPFRGNSVTLSFDDAPPANVEHVLAHEFAHVIQRSVNATDDVPLDHYHLASSTLEGGAEYVEDVYARRHQNVSSLAKTRRAYRNATAMQRWALAPYYFGARYMDSRVDSPAELTDVYENPPTTTEQVIHGYAPDEEPGKPLAVTVEDAGGRAVDARTRKGEMFVRVALTTELNESRAAAAAAGWGNDTLVRFRDRGRSGEPGYAWILRWDDPANATEFRRAIETLFDRRADRTGERWRRGNASYRVERVGAETVAVFAGDSGFVDGATVDGNGSSVTVTVESEHERTSTT